MMSVGCGGAGSDMSNDWFHTGLVVFFCTTVWKRLILPCKWRVSESPHRFVHAPSRTFLAALATLMEFFASVLVYGRGWPS